LTTNTGEQGTNFKNKVSHFNSSLLLGERKYNFSSFSESKSIYDGYLELSGIVFNKIFNLNLNLEFDINGTKKLDTIKSDYLFSSKICTKPICKYSIDIYPYENNILLNRTTDIINTGVINFGYKVDYVVSEPNFNRLIVDAHRIFGSMHFYKNEFEKRYKNEFEKRIEFKVVNFIFKPLRYIKNLFYIP
jgi:hypothetical protein